MHDVLVDVTVTLNLNGYPQSESFQVHSQINGNFNYTVIAELQRPKGPQSGAPYL